MTKLDEACIRVAMTTARSLMNHGSPLHAVLVVPVWKNDEETGYQSAPTVLGDADALPWLCKVLRETADRIDRGEYLDLGHVAPVGEA